MILHFGYTPFYHANSTFKAETANWPYMGHKFELQTSRSVIPNRNDAPDQMAATRASGEGSKTEAMLSKHTQKKQKAEGSGGMDDPSGGAPPPRTLPLFFIQCILFKIGSVFEPSVAAI